MNYPNEMHLFLLQNPNLIEAGSLTDAVEVTIFTAIHERLAKKFERLLWEVRCDAFSDSEDSCEETMFAPMHWPKAKDKSRQAYYRLGTFGAGNVYWLSSLLGLNETHMCFELCIDGRLGGPKVNVKKRVQSFYTETPALMELGFVCLDGKLCLPFTLDAVKLAAEYPDLRKSMLAFEAFFDRLMKGHEHIDKLVLGMMPPQAAKVAE